MLRWVVLGAAIAGLRFALRWISLILQRRLNPVLAMPPYEVPGETAIFHDHLIVADLHSDALLWDTDLVKWNMNRPCGHSAAGGWQCCIASL